MQSARPAAQFSLKRDVDKGEMLDEGPQGRGRKKRGDGCRLAHFVSYLQLRGGGASYFRTIPKIGKMMERRDFLTTGPLLIGGLMTTNGMTQQKPVVSGPLKPYSRRMTAENCRALLGGGAILTFLADGESTNGQYALFEARGIPGMEPRPHTHAREDETMYVLEGHFYVRVGEEEFELKKGDFLFMPRNIQHEFRVLSQEFHCQVGLYPAGLDQYFKKLSVPHDSLQIPPPATEPPSPEVMEQIMALNEEFGIRG